MARPICVLGNANLDLVMGAIGAWPEPGTETFLPRSDMRIGGSAANTALVLSRLGAPNGLISGCGSDMAGEMIADRFQGDLDRIERFSDPTGVSVGVLFEEAERSFLSIDGHLAKLELPVFLRQLKDWPLDGAIALVSGAFAMPGLLAHQEALIDHLRLSGAEIAIDPGWPGGGWTDASRRAVRRWIGKSDHVLLNDKETCALAGCADLPAALDALQEGGGAGARLVVKCGADGAICRNGRETIRAHAPRREVFDTVGAGDAFNAGYLAAIACDAGIETALSAGAHVASDVIAEFPRAQTRISLTELALAS